MTYQEIQAAEDARREDRHDLMIAFGEKQREEALIRAPILYDLAGERAINTLLTFHIRRYAVEWVHLYRLARLYGLEDAPVYRDHARKLIRVLRQARQYRVGR